MSEIDKAKLTAEELRELIAGFDSIAADRQRFVEAAKANHAAMETAIRNLLALRQQSERERQNIMEIATALKGKLSRLDTAIADLERGFSVDPDDAADDWKRGGAD